MDMSVHGDSRRNTMINDHVIVKGDFEYLKHVHNIRHNSWLKFTLDQETRCHWFQGGYYVVFKVKKMQ